MTALPEVEAGNAALAGGRLDEARALFQRALARAPYEAAVYEGLARVFSAQGAWARVAGCWAQVGRLHPNHAPAIAALARAHQRAGTYVAAASAWRRLLQRAPGSVEAHVQLALCLVRTGEPAAARALLEALPAEARARPDALVAGAFIDQVFGEGAAARDALERALALEPRLPAAYEALADLRPWSPDDPLIGAASELAAAPDLDVEGRIALGYALGRMHDAAGAPAVAWSSYLAANAAQAARHPPEQTDPARLARFAAAIEAGFGRPGARAPVTAQRAPEPIFIVGMPRSGTTLVEAILAQSPQVAAGGEIAKLTELARSVLGVDDIMTGDPGRLATLDADAYGRLADRYRLALTHAAPAARFVTDKLPANFMWIGLIRRLFPTAPIVHVRRNPRDVAWSCFIHHFDDGYTDMAGLDRIVAYQRFHARLMQFWRSTVRDALIELDYHALVGAPERVAETLVRACGLAWDVQHLDFHQRRTAVRTFSRLQIREPIHARAAGKWRPFATQLEPWFAQLATGDD